MNRESYVEVTDGVQTWKDAERAHAEADDTAVGGEYQKFIPETCIHCQTKALANREAQKAAEGSK